MCGGVYLRGQSSHHRLSVFAERLHAFKTLVEIRKVSTGAALVLSDRLGINFLAAFIDSCGPPQPLEELKARPNVGL